VYYLMCVVLLLVVNGSQDSTDGGGYENVDGNEQFDIQCVNWP
jgi:hypothetical protein